MPELPEVQTVVDTLGPHLVGQRILAFRLNRNDFATPPGFDWEAALVGRRVIDVSRRAKRIVVTIEDRNRFYVHLGMSGRLLFGSAELPVLNHTHVLFDVAGGQVRLTDPRRFGGLHWLGLEPDDPNLGPEPLTLRPDHLAERLSRTKRPVKSALLDQSFIAGIGNIYADEALFAAGIHPLTPCHALDRPAAGRLSRAIKTTLNTAISFKGSTLRDYRDASGKPGGFQLRHRVYDRAGQPCRRCRTPIERLILSGRSTHHCPTCQPATR